MPGPKYRLGLSVASRVVWTGSVRRSRLSPGAPAVELPPPPPPQPVWICPPRAGGAPPRRVAAPLAPTFLPPVFPG